MPQSNNVLSLLKHILPYLFLLVLALLLRWQTLGNPMVEVDEQFYLFAGGRLLDGDLPFVDVWDRKPFGLFLLYAFFHLFGSYRIWAYQIGALLSLWGTALLVRRMAATIAPAKGAFAAAALYEIWPNLAGGEGGQSPIFYNFLTASAIALLLTYLPRMVKSSTVRRNTGCAAMLLFGLAIQIKYTAIFEGCFVGLYLLWSSWKSRTPLRTIAQDTALWISAAILPTLSVFLFYWSIGHATDWWYANITSIFHRGALPHKETLFLILKILIIIAPLFFCWLLRTRLKIVFSDTQKNKIHFLDAWTGTSLAGVAVFSPWYNHYALPVFVPLAVQAAPLWGNRIGRGVMLMVAAVGTLQGQLILWKHQVSKGNKTVFSELEQAIGSTGKGCFFIYDGPTLLYDTLPYCKLSTHQFPSHFYFQSEVNATGMNPLSEIQSILAKKPDHIVTQEPASPIENMVVRNALYATLNRDYTPTYTWTRKHRSIVVYTRKAALSPLPHPDAALTR
ncbi:hypothetical protein ACI01nite_08910 [Acetobacter cibinongensis]|uniref:Glycosyltransferase RgtA/B/C/D-like domain-containing protein n=2 Tax=Acetobacter cibinongensis TaxID=146475 RepID=A0A0D6N3C0_9PROT|nr:hypothetical protein Abci_010_080 [Acetobacter cibinongensis]GEL58289.1 hypothetical protein ACI01nite_08910 [Acetobacter cibinongensis]